MANDDPTKSLVDWCASRLGPGALVPLVPAAGGQMSDAYRYDVVGTAAAVKVRSAPLDRIKRCLDAQRTAAAGGFPCATPLAGAEALDADVVVSAETWRPGGEMLPGDGADSAGPSSALLAELISVLEAHPRDSIDPPPPWITWNPPGGGPWPPNGPIDRMDQTPVPDALHEYARRISARLSQSALPHVLGHGDWEAQNIRWKDSRPWAVYDWDSLVLLPEAAIVGAASGAFASAKVPTLASIAGSHAFIRSYESARGLGFTDDEREIAWAASMWPALHNSRGEHLFGANLVASAAVMDQAEQRLTLAGA